MKPRLLFVVNVDWFFLSHRLPIALEASRSGYEVHLATAITDKLDILKNHDLVVHPLALDRSGMNLVSALRTFVQIWQLFRFVKPNLVHLVTIKPVVLGGLAARLARVPAVVVAISGLGFVFVAQGWLATLRRWLVGGLYRVVFGHSNLKVIFQNQDDQFQVTKLTGLPTQSMVLIRGSGVDLEQYRYMPLPDDRLPVVMLAGRLLVDKGVREFVQAAKILKNAGVMARFVLVGTLDPDNPSSLSEHELMHWADEGVVELWGQRPDMYQALAESQIVVLPSYREGLPKILIEAAACGRVVVTTDVPGCRDAILPGITGFLVPVCDDQALAENILQLLENRVLCESMGKAGRVFAERVFDVRQVVEKHLQIYNELLEKVK
jgi:glycosyltransferase involved in cell wall biosynthesis